MDDRNVCNLSDFVCVQSHTSRRDGSGQLAPRSGLASSRTSIHRSGVGRARCSGFAAMLSLPVHKPEFSRAIRSLAVVLQSGYGVERDGCLAAAAARIIFSELCERDVRGPTLLLSSDAGLGTCV